MLQARQVGATAHKILTWLRSQDLTPLWGGIRFDCAMALRVAPNDPVYRAAWTYVRFTLDGNGNTVPYLDFS